jgi:hypothetical protein
MKLFRTINMAGSYWGVFLVNPNDNRDRYLVSSTFDREQDAENIAAEFNRIAEESPTSQMKWELACYL